MVEKKPLKLSNPMAVICTDFMTAHHLLPEESIHKLIEIEGGRDIPLTDEDVTCVNCCTSVMNWLQLDKFLCPPRERVNPLQKYHQPKLPGL